MRAETELKKHDLYSGIFWLLLSLFVGGISLLGLGLGSLNNPAPGFYPFLVSALLMGISIALIIRAMGGKKGPEFNLRSLFGRNIPGTMAALFAYAVVLEHLGFVVSTALLLIYLFKFTASRTWLTSLLMTAIIVTVSYVFFVLLLQSQLPPGILDRFM